MHFPRFLKVVIMSKTQEVRIDETTTIKKNVFDAIAVKFTETLAQSLRFSYELVPPPNGEFGRQLPDGNWTGMVGMVQRSLADDVISILAISEERGRVIDFSYPIQREKVTFATRKPEYVPDAGSFLWPFSTEVWICILACHVVMPCFFKALLKSQFTFRKLICAVHQTFLNQSIGISPVYARDYFLIGFWILGVLFITYSYIALLLSFLTFPTLKGVRTVPELAAAVAKGKYQCVCYPGSYIVKTLVSSSDSDARIIGSSLQKNKGSRDIGGVLRSAKSKKKSAFIATRDYFLAYKTKYFISDDEFFPAMRSVAMRKGFCCKVQLDRIIGYLWASGIYEKWIDEAAFKESLKKIHDDADSSEKNNQLSIEDVEGAFVLLSTGYVLSIIAFIGELIHKRSKAKKHISSSKRLHRKLWRC